MRAQANVVGVAILVGVTVVALGTLTAAIGAVVEEDAARADARRVADGFGSALEPVEATGPRRGTLAFVEGDLRPVDRQVRVLNGSGVVAAVEADALVFEAGERRVTYLGGAVVRGRPPGGSMHTPPPITASRDGGALVVGVARLGDPGAVGGSGRVAVRTNVSHERTDLGTGTFRVAVETATPRPWRAYFERAGATVTTRDLDGDGVPSVVARFPGERRAWLVVHDLRAEVGA
ncbi:DUF7289 family protein [Halosegnis marinus]|uniref:Type IV pilin n=1 Tax=Halosegnis marinus TaxID=3034023 RepID=A0ABD5ZN48_9EURY|nr:type IV pilin [Halosegnis sp. DT85]